jgi:hypothetical protein
VCTAYRAYCITLGLRSCDHCWLVGVLILLFRGLLFGSSTLLFGAGVGERNWSAYGHVLSDLRTLLRSERAKNLVFVYFNSKILNKVNKVDFVDEIFEWDEAAVEEDEALEFIEG